MQRDEFLNILESIDKKINKLTSNTIIKDSEENENNEGEEL